MMYPVDTMIPAHVNKDFTAQMDLKVPKRSCALLADTAPKEAQHRGCAREERSVITHNYGEKINVLIALLDHTVWRMD